ncbi:MAG: formylglycine-generating enzyme family protein [Planctomycetes bacterium]|nr:formylglycine-generating enzyme family protein [Planctomycetota bacterium]
MRALQTRQREVRRERKSLVVDPASQATSQRAALAIPPFLICATECTQAAWKEVMGTDPSHFKGARRPVEGVSWTDAQSFCTRSGFRLPIEAEWEFACRAGTTTKFGFGDSEGDLGRYAWFKGNSGSETKDVAGKLPNAFGLHDMHGNVWEFPARDTPSASRLFFRGGCWKDLAKICDSAFRASTRSGRRGNYLGFRPARSLQGVDPPRTPATSGEKVRTPTPRDYALRFEGFTDKEIRSIVAALQESKGFSKWKDCGRGKIFYVYKCAYVGSAPIERIVKSALARRSLAGCKVCKTAYNSNLQGYNVNIQKR